LALTFHQLHIFYTVAEKGSFSVAAQALHMTQPAVTMQVQALEEFFGTKLFVRSPRKVELTDSGLALLPYAKESLQFMQRAVTGMSVFMENLKGQLAFGASLTIGEYVLPRFLGLFSKQHPEITIQLRVVNTSQLVEGLLNHQIGFALVEAPVHHPDIVTEPVLHDELVLIYPPNHELANLPYITLTDVLQHPFILREKGSGTRQVIEERFQIAGVDTEALRVTMELASTGAIKSAVQAGLGISIISKSTIDHELALGLLATRAIEHCKIERHFYSAVHRSALLPVAAQTFLHFLRQ
jgi:DNA-binding transcriptional LysR family regulator